MKSRRKAGKLLLTGMFAAALAASSTATVPQAVDLTLQMDQDVRSAHETQKAIIKIGLKGNEFDKAMGRPPVNLSIGLDRSGSMTTEKLAKVKEAAIAAVRRLSPSDIFSLIAYAQNVETIVPAQNVNNVEDIVSRINAIAPTKGNTALFGGLSIAAHEIRKNADRKYIRRIVLMSDGKANAGPSGVDDMGRLAQALKKENISVTTVGVGDDYNEDLMTILAAKSDGNTYYVKTIDDVARIFTAELGDMLSVVAKNVNVSLTCPDGVIPTSIINREGKIQGQQVTMSMSQLYGGQEKYALVEVMIPQSKATGTLEIANATISYDNALTRTNESAAGNANLKFSQRHEDILNSTTNTIVQNNYYANMAAVAQDTAIELADEGKILQAAEELRRNSLMLRWNGTQNGDKSLIQTADDMDAQADQIGQKGLSPQSRKAFRANSWQTKSQQFTK